MSNGDRDGQICVGPFCVGLIQPFGVPRGGLGERRPPKDPGPPRLPPSALPSAQPLPRQPSTPQTFPPQTSPAPGTIDFPDLPAANEPFFKARKSIFKVLGRFPLFGRVIDIAEVLVATLEGIQNRSVADVLRRQAVDLENLLRRIADRKARDALADLRATKLEQAPPGVQDFPDVPQPAPAPQTAPVGDPLPAPGSPSVPTRPSTLPSTRPASIPLPQPGAVPVPRRSPLPESAPLPTPGRRPFPLSLPLPFSFPQSSPLTVGDLGLLSSASPGTASQIRGSTFADVQNFPVPEVQPDVATKCKPRRCDDDLEEARVECFKGLYREGPKDTDFTQWTQVDCLTGKEL